MSEPASPFAAAASGVHVRVRLTPRARHNRVGGMQRDDDGLAVLRVAVTAPPEGGKANAALIRTLAKAWRLPRTAMAIASGAAGRRKTVVVEGDATTLMPRFEDWMERHHG